MHNRWKMTPGCYFSIVIPTFNRGSMIISSINSVLGQTFQDFEIIVVDDGSKDNTRELITAMMQSDQRIKYVYQENSERGKARNNGFWSASGQYVLFFDSDDEMKKDHLEVLSRAIEQHPTYDIYATKFAFKENGRIDESPVMKIDEGPKGIEFALKGNPLGTLYCFKKKTEGLSLFPEDRNLAIMEDWICLIQNLAQRPVYLIDKVTVFMNNHEGRSMSQNQLVIERRLKATNVILASVSLSRYQQRILRAYSFYFCGIHAYLDRNRKQAIHYGIKAIKVLGLKLSFVGLVCKSLIGKKTINRIKSLMRKDHSI